jgi:hypothetical protein
MERARRRGGRPRKPAAMRRDCLIRSYFTLVDHADLVEIAHSWGVPPGTVVWGIVASQLARWRRLPRVELGELELKVAASLEVYRGRGEVQAVSGEAGLAEGEVSGRGGSRLEDDTAD